MVGTKQTGEVKNSIGNGEAKELIYMTHGHELRGVNADGEGSAGQRGIKVSKKRDNCNSIINKIYLKKDLGSQIHGPFIHAL